jgi:hypothetical protein
MLRSNSDKECHLDKNCPSGRESEISKGRGYFGEVIGYMLVEKKIGNGYEI